MLRDGARLVGAGCLVGALLSVAAVQSLRPFLAAGQSPIDPLAFVAIPLVLLAIATVASFWPARRAASVDPAIALRHE